METPSKAQRPAGVHSRRWFWVALICLGSVLAVTKYFGTYSGEARAARRFLEEMPVAEIREIQIEPYTVLSLTDHVIVIRDREKISRIAAIFRGMTAVSPNHPSANWVSIIRFQLADRQCGGQIESTNNQGGLFWFASNVRGGWNYGCYRNDALGPFFEQLVAEEKGRK